MIGAQAVILAAGTSSRAGRQKLLTSFRGQTMIDYAIAAAKVWNPLVVCGPEVERYLLGRTGVALVRNAEPQRGMSHSLALANRVVPAELSLIVLLGDKPLVTPSLIESILAAAGDADFVYPQRDGVPGHPVVLSPRARNCIDALPPGDTIRFLRERPELKARAVDTLALAAVFDVDVVKEAP